MSEYSILVIGDGSTGKTHYGAQLLLRLEAQRGLARYFEPPENIEPLQEAMNCLNRGVSADHTVGSTTKEVVLPLEFQGSSRARVVWPDYAGERLRELVRNRHAGDSWSVRAANANAWLLLVRPSQLIESRDLLNRPVATWIKSRTDPQKSTDQRIEWMPQARHVELLQMLLFLGKPCSTNRLAAPRLGVALSCWDEFPEREKYKHPGDALKTLAPLLSDFVESNWDPSARFVVGLSATGRPLDKTRPDEEFVDTGPTAHGWVIKPNGEQTDDLTWPLVHLLNDE